MKLSVIIPVYNEEETLEEIINRVFTVNIGDIEKEVIICDDGSYDRTNQIIQDLHARYPDLISYHSPTNLGKGASVRIGIAISTGELIMIQDADLELSPNDYPTLLSHIVNHETKIVYGSRFLQSNVKIKRTSYLANRFLTNLTNILFGSKLTDMETAYKMFLRETLDGVRLRCAHFDFEPEITANFLSRGFKILEVPISYNPRTVKGGKKISWIDGYEAIYTLIRCRFTSR
jgi:dolichol-phosphate mannosyltransferase